MNNSKINKIDKSLLKKLRHNKALTEDETLRLQGLLEDIFRKAGFLPKLDRDIQVN